MNEDTMARKIMDEVSLWMGAVGLVLKMLAAILILVAVYGFIAVAIFKVLL